MDAPPERRAGTTGQVKRRGLIAGAAALLAAGLAKLAEAAHKPTETTYDGQHVLHVDQVNTTASITEIRRSGSANGPALQVNNLANGGDGMVAATIGAGKAGVLGENNSAADSPGGLGGIGVLGHNSNTSPTTNSIGVQGFVLTPSSVGVQGINFGNSASAVAVQGLSADGGVLLSGVGVHGKSGSGTGVGGEAATGIGVLGAATGASDASPGVYGAATQGYGVFGFSANSNGIAGQSGGSAAGCVGFAGAPGGYGIYGGSPSKAATPGDSRAQCWSMGHSRWSMAPRTPQCPTRTARTACCTAWRARRAGSRTSARPSWSTVAQRWRSIKISRRWSRRTRTRCS